MKEALCAAVCTLLLIGAGYNLGKASIIVKCDERGTFTSSTRVYECKEAK